MYSRHNDRKYVVAERLIRTLKNKIYKYTTLALKNVYIDTLDDIVHEYNNKYHSTIKMKHADVKSSTFMDFNKENNKEDPKFEVGDYVTVSKYKIIFAKGSTPDWPEEVLVIKKILCSGHMLLMILKVKKLLEFFTKKNCKKQIRKSLEFKVIK